jgi:ribosomal protein S6
MTDYDKSQEGGEVYELGYLILPSLAEGNLGSVVEKLKKIIQSVGGVEVASEDPMKQELAYEMTKVVGASRYVVKEAYIGWIKFEAPKAEAPKVNEAVTKLDEILRAILIKAPRETEFTFAKAKAAMEEKIAKAEADRKALENVEESGPAVETVVE